MFVHVQYAPLTHACIIHVHVYVLLHTYSLEYMYMHVHYIHMHVIHTCTPLKTCVYTHSSHIHPPSIHTQTQTHTHSQVLPADHTPFFFLHVMAAICLLPSSSILQPCLSQYECYRIDILLPSSGLNLVTTVMLYPGGSMIALMFVSMYLSFVLLSEYGVLKNPFYPIIGRLSKFGAST